MKPASSASENIIAEAAATSVNILWLVNLKKTHVFYNALNISTDNSNALVVNTRQEDGLSVKFFDTNIHHATKLQRTCDEYSHIYFENTIISTNSRKLISYFVSNKTTLNISQPIYLLQNLLSNT